MRTFRQNGTVHIRTPAERRAGSTRHTGPTFAHERPDGTGHRGHHGRDPSRGPDNNPSAGFGAHAKRTDIP